MSNKLQTGMILLAVPALLAACSTPPKPVAVVAPPKPAHPLFTLDTPVKRIAADPAGKAILVRDMPGLMASSKYDLFDDMSLSEIAMLSHGRLTKTKLALVQSDLVQLSDAEPAN